MTSCSLSGKAALGGHPGTQSALDRVGQRIGPSLVLVVERHHLPGEVLRHIRAEVFSENPRVRSGPSGIQTSTDRFGKPGLMLIVMFGHRK